MYKISIVSISALAVLLATSSAQDPMAKGGRPGPKATLTPFHRLSSAAKFNVIQPDKANFIEMQSVIGAIPAPYAAKTKGSKIAVQMDYGYKKGGISSVYECEKIPGVSAVTLFNAIIDSRLFKERKYFKEWSIVEVPHKNLLIAVSGTTPAVRDAMVKAIKSKF